MKKALILCIIVLFCGIRSKADHITGGEFFYTYINNNNGTVTYDATYKLFMRCNSNRRFNDPTIVSIFDKGSNTLVSNVSVPLTSSETIQLADADPCITNPPRVCYVVGYYNFQVTLPASANGYVMASQVNFRISGINNLEPGYNNIGALYTAEIPGTSLVSNGAQNNSARFEGSDLVVVCAANRFSYSFAAADRDGDELRYSFCNAYRSSGGGNMVSPTQPPPFLSVPYGNRYTGTAPLGLNVKINPATGLITGIAPASGVYVITVCVEEVRDGKIIATQRKDLQINITSCNIAAAILQPEYSLCKDTKSITLSNLSNSPLIRTYFWEITNTAGAVVNTSAETNLTYTFADTGIYNVKLVINRGQTCTDSTTSFVRVYPGFVPGFDYTGICFSKPTRFTDLTKTVYGKVDSWNWSLGSATSEEQNPEHRYETMGLKNVQLIVTNTVGCRDTASRQFSVVDSPLITLPFSDTLICKNDPVTLLAQGSGELTWSPVANAINANSAAPTVSPSATTTYTVRLNDNGCVNLARVVVRVTDRVNLQAMNDTTICQGDTIRLRLVSDAFKYSWSPASQLLNPDVASPFAITTATTNYIVTASIGGCKATDNINVTAVPYPFANAGNDVRICFNSSVQLAGTTNAPQMQWFPANTLSNPTITNPLASPADTTSYILFAYDTKGCPKPGQDTVVVFTLPPILASAGNDTTAVVEQPLQLNATGGVRYQWTPDIG
ncbi:MAG TPA: PKD domain-containing protein, partial [Segetibacter sp.]